MEERLLDEAHVSVLFQNPAGSVVVPCPKTRTTTPSTLIAAWLDQTMSPRCARNSMQLNALDTRVIDCASTHHTSRWKEEAPEWLEAPSRKCGSDARSAGHPSRGERLQSTGNARCRLSKGLRTGRQVRVWEGRSGAASCLGRGRVSRGDNKEDAFKHFEAGNRA